MAFDCINHIFTYFDRVKEGFKKGLYQRNILEAFCPSAALQSTTADPRITWEIHGKHDFLWSLPTHLTLPNVELYNNAFPLDFLNVAFIFYWLPLKTFVSLLHMFISIQRNSTYSCLFLLLVFFNTEIVPCEGNLRCGRGCFQTEEGAICVCPEGSFLQEDGHACTGMGGLYWSDIQSYTALVCGISLKKIEVFCRMHVTRQRRLQPALHFCYTNWVAVWLSTRVPPPPWRKTLHCFGWVKSTADGQIWSQ